ncbi:MAG: type I-E CRISPR-associated endoribonuclease Cas2 [Lachnospiraceae bacterium]|nr:type I-E CRISPR-associated endoribonuclease Cas2 [Lachnospiraceae bacterium]
MMLVLVLSDCPQKLRGDVTKWLFEINTGVYVGNLSARVRDELWERICESLKDGRASMVYHTQGEQHLDFRVHNSRTWKPVDIDGIKLMKRLDILNNSGDCEENAFKSGFSKAAKYVKLNGVARSRERTGEGERYIVVDLETTGISAIHNHIIEIGAILFENGIVEEEFSCLVKINDSIPKEISNLTGITDELLNEQGIGVEEALKKFKEFIGEEHLLAYNASFDMSFLQAALRINQMDPITNRWTDINSKAKRKIGHLSDYKLATVAQHLDLEVKDQHRAIPDCYLAMGVYEKLKEKR